MNFWKHDYIQQGSGFEVRAWREVPNTPTFYHIRGYTEVEDDAQRAVTLFNVDHRSAEAYALLEQYDDEEA